MYCKQGINSTEIRYSSALGLRINLTRGAVVTMGACGVVVAQLQRAAFQPYRASSRLRPSGRSLDPLTNILLYLFPAHAKRSCRVVLESEYN
jgi:hypothetical protein